MSFTQVEVTGTVELGDNSPAAGAVVLMELAVPITDGSIEVNPLRLTATCNGSGVFAVLAVNAEPLGTAYRVDIVYQGVVIRHFNVVIAATMAPSVDLFSLLVPATLYDGGSPGAVYDITQDFDGGFPDSFYLASQTLDGGSL